LGEIIGNALCKRLGVDGQGDPSHATLADDADGWSVKTVRRSLDTMRDLGLVMWQRRLMRDGWRTRQTSNAYVLTLTANPENRGKPCEGQKVHGTPRIEIHPVQPMLIEVSERERTGGRAVLAQVAARRQATVLAAMTAKRD
jgi:hypothetical protein